MVRTTSQSRIKSLALVLLSFACLLLGTTQPTQAQQTSSSIAQGFQADTINGDIVPGALVSIKPGTSHTVELATPDTSDQLVGVVDKNPLVSISGDNQEAQVVLSGTTSVLVSDINGAIHSGDKITPSPIAGVGMLA